MADEKKTNKPVPMDYDDAMDAIEDILTRWALDNGTAAKADVTLGSARALVKSKS